VVLGEDKKVWRDKRSSLLDAAAKPFCMTDYKVFEKRMAEET
jgi:hypothetical protein